MRSHDNKVNVVVLRYGNDARKWAPVIQSITVSPHEKGREQINMLGYIQSRPAITTKERTALRLIAWWTGSVGIRLHKVGGHESFPFCPARYGGTPKHLSMDYCSPVIH
jgi:hypothetical protein